MGAINKEGVISFIEGRRGGDPPIWIVCENGSHDEVSYEETVMPGMNDELKDDQGEIVALRFWTRANIPPHWPYHLWYYCFGDGEGPEIEMEDYAKRVVEIGTNSS